MEQGLSVTILGCGSSGGVPLVGCQCVVCQSNHPKNNRTRASILLKQRVELAGGNTQTKKLLIDTSPDLRQQLLRERISTVHAILYTHAHADHTHGIDDTRSLNYNAGRAMDIFGDADTMADLQARFPFRFREALPEYGTHKLIANVVKAGTEVEIAGFAVRLFHQTHGKGKTLGIRVGNFAYSTDVSALDDAAFAALEGVEVWVVDCLKSTPSPTHSHLPQTLKWIKRVRPKRAILTHLSHEFDYERLQNQLPDGVEVAYDGMKITL